MVNQLVITVVGRDRPGLVEQLAATIAQHNASWQASNMSQLSGQFAGILQINVTGQNTQPLVQALDKLPDLQVLIAQGEAAAIENEPAKRHAALSITANDRAGIVSEISGVLAAHQVNVEKLETDTASAPNWGHALFKASLHLSVPVTISEGELTEALESLADDLMVELSFDN